MKKFFYGIVMLVVSLIIGLSACTGEELVPIISTSEAKVVVAHGSALDRALQNADEFFSKMGYGTRDSRQVENISVFAEQNTRSGESDTLLFLVNYTGNKGFALLGAEGSLYDIYAIAPEGHMTYEDIQNNEFLSDFVYDVLVSNIPTPVVPWDSISVDWKYWCYRLVDTVRPRITSVSMYWNQDAPYNRYTLDAFGNPVPVGCGAVSIGTFLSFYKRPVREKYVWGNKSIKKFDFYWDAIIGRVSAINADSLVARMFAFLGNPDLLNIEYASSGSQFNAKTLLPALQKLGCGYVLFNGNKLNDILIDSAANFLIRGRNIRTAKSNIKYKAAPLLCLGMGTYDKNAQHAWVIDGVITRERCKADSKGRPLEIKIGDAPHYEKTYPMWHCLWGQKYWKYNGWYVYLKDKNNRFYTDTIQYDPFTKKIVITGQGALPTGVKLYRSYSEWTIFGGCFPDTIRG